MKRYITSSRKDDLIKEKNAWQMKYDARKQLYEDQERNYHNAHWDWIDNLVNIITNQFKSYIDKLPGLVITADRSWGNVEIHFNYEDRWNTPRESKSLLWSYEVQLTESGEIRKESNSWSGFQAVTSEQIDDLMNSANLLKAIVEFDWAPVLEEAKKTQPKYRNYVGIRDPNNDPDYKDPGYDKMIKEAELDEAINSGKWIKGSDSWGGGAWYFIISQTPKFYDVAKFTLYSIRWALTHEGPNNEQLLEEVRNPQTISKYSRERIKKENLSLAKPIETKTGEELIQLAQQSVSE